jgi:hypothetical protein
MQSLAALALLLLLSFSGSDGGVLWGSHDSFSGSASEGGSFSESASHHDSFSGNHDDSFDGNFSGSDGLGSGSASMWNLDANTQIWNGFYVRGLYDPNTCPEGGLVDGHELVGKWRHSKVTL